VGAFHVQTSLAFFLDLRRVADRASSDLRFGFGIDVDDRALLVEVGVKEFGATLNINRSPFGVQSGQCSLGGHMIRAIAFHTSLALEKLHEYFADESAQFSAVSIGTKCEKCGLSFAIVLPMKNDPKNQEYTNELNEMIAEDCINGMHQEEYVLGRVH
jgi:hypothetical protein